MRPNQSQGAEWGLLSFCIGSEGCFLALRASALGCFSIISVEVTMVLPWGGFYSDISPWKSAVLHSISQSTAVLKISLNFHKQKRKGPLFLMTEPRSQKKDLLLSLNRLSLLLGGPWALFCMPSSKGQHWRSLWHLCNSVLMWLWADYLDKDQRMPDPVSAHYLWFRN